MLGACLDCPNDPRPPTADHNEHRDSHRWLLPEEPGARGVLRRGDAEKEITGGFRKTTNNRMELMAAIAGLRALKEPCQVALVSDSRYVVDGISKGWARRWRDNGWHRNPREMASNPDLWEELLTLNDKHDVKFKWVRGHAGNAKNERCDRLAVEAAKQPDLPVDEGYESGAPPNTDA